MSIQAWMYADNTIYISSGGSHISTMHYTLFSIRSPQLSVMMNSYSDLEQERKAVNQSWSAAKGLEHVCPSETTSVPAILSNAVETISLRLKSTQRNAMVKTYQGPPSKLMDWGEWRVDNVVAFDKSDFTRSRTVSVEWRQHPTARWTCSYVLDSYLAPCAIQCTAAACVFYRILVIGFEIIDKPNQIQNQSN